MEVLKTKVGWGWGWGWRRCTFKPAWGRRSQAFSWIFRTKLKTTEIQRDRLAVLVSPTSLFQTKAEEEIPAEAAPEVAEFSWITWGWRYGSRWKEERILWIEMYWARKGDWPVNVDLQLLLCLTADVDIKCSEARSLNWIRNGRTNFWPQLHHLLCGHGEI